MAPKEVSSVSSAEEAVFGQPLLLPGELASRSEASPMDFLDKLASSAPLAMFQPRTYAEVISGPSQLAPAVSHDGVH